MLEKFSGENGKMMRTAIDSVTEASELARDLCAPSSYGETREYCMRSVARRLGISARSVKAIIYREVSRIDSHVMDNLRAMAARNLQDAQRSRDAVDFHAMEMVRGLAPIAPLERVGPPRHGPDGARAEPEGEIG